MNVSHGGARLHLDGGFVLPSDFEVRITVERLPRSARLVWRSADAEFLPPEGGAGVLADDGSVLIVEKMITIGLRPAPTPT